MLSSYLKKKLLTFHKILVGPHSFLLLFLLIRVNDPPDAKHLPKNISFPSSKFSIYGSHPLVGGGPGGGGGSQCTNWRLAWVSVPVSTVCCLTSLSLSVPVMKKLRPFPPHTTAAEINWNKLFQVLSAWHIRNVPQI